MSNGLKFVFRLDRDIAGMISADAATRLVGTDIPVTVQGSGSTVGRVEYIDLDEEGLSVTMIIDDPAAFRERERLAASILRPEDLSGT